MLCKTNNLQNAGTTQTASIESVSLRRLVVSETRGHLARGPIGSNWSKRL